MRRNLQTNIAVVGFITSDYVAITLLCRFIMRIPHFLSALAAPPPNAVSSKTICGGLTVNPVVVLHLGRALSALFEKPRQRSSRPGDRKGTITCCGWAAKSPQFGSTAAFLPRSFPRVVDRVNNSGKTWSMGRERERERERAALLEGFRAF